MPLPLACSSVNSPAAVPSCARPAATVLFPVEMYRVLYRPPLRTLVWLELVNAFCFLATLAAVRLKGVLAPMGAAATQRLLPPCRAGGGEQLALMAAATLAAAGCARVDPVKLLLLNTPAPNRPSLCHHQIIGSIQQIAENASTYDFFG